MKKLLLIRLSSMGDVIFNIPLASVFKKAGYQVDWLVSEKGFQLLKGNPCVDNVILAPVEKWKKTNDFWGNFKEYISILKQLRSNNYDISIDTQGLFKSCKWNMFCKAKKRLISLSCREFSFLGANVILPSNSKKNRHVIRDYLEFAKYLKLDTENISVCLPKSDEHTIEKVNEYLKNVNTNKKMVVICPATTWDTKHWDKDNWKKVIENIENDYELVFTGQDKDKELVSYIGGDKHINLVGKTNLYELSEIFSRAELVVSLDSGNTHLAWATQKPKIITIFCSTPIVKYAPIGASDKYVALGNEACKPCHKKKCKYNTSLCTKSTSAEIVINKIREMLR